MTQSILIRPHQPGWITDFQRIAQRLKPALPGGALLHHIGSTAVPNLAAKAVIDVQVTVDHLNHVDVAAVEGAGFGHYPGRVDHAPVGQTLATEDMTKLFFKLDEPLAHIHVRERGRFNQRFALLCRDYLRAHAEAAAAYEAIKIQLAAQFPDDPDAYNAIKDPVFDVVMVGANAWAAATGWVQPPGD